MSGEHTSDGSGHGSVESKVTPTSTPTPVITEDAEPIYVNERRDTTEAPPLVVESVLQPAVGEIDVPTPPPMPMAAASSTLDTVATEIDPASDATVPTPAIAAAALPAIPALPATPRRAQTAADQVARQRGVTPIRVPSVSRRYEAVSPSNARRRFVIGASTAAGVCVGVAIGAIAWARSAGSDAEHGRSAVVAPVVVEAPRVVPVEPVPAAPTVCSIRVEANTEGAALSVNGVRHGTAPAVVQAPCNTNATIELRHPRYEEFRQVIAVNEDLELDVKLEREKTTLALWSEPAGAEVTYNGVVLGKTPLVAKVPRYEQGTVWFRAPGHAADWRRIMPTQKRKTLSIKLKGMLLAPPS